MTPTENKKKKYCLICHMFKPDRAHHCSWCQRCVLGMDHHCPWLSVCIGFNNRKYFIQTLVYSFITLLTIVIIHFKEHIKYLILMSLSVYNKEQIQTLSIIKISAYFFIVFILVLLGKFLYFHLMLIRKNNTTIEYLDS